jgi:hypothetical protein
MFYQRVPPDFDGISYRLGKKSSVFNNAVSFLITTGYSIFDIPVNFSL